MAPPVMRIVPKSKVLETKLKRPANAGEYWKGFRHSEVLKGLSDQIKNKGWRVAEEEYVLSDDGYDLLAIMTFHPDYSPLKTSKMGSQAIVLQTSNAIRCRTRLWAGIWEQECRVFIPHGGTRFARHTTHADALVETVHAMKGWKEILREAIARFSLLQNTGVTQEEVDAFIMQASRIKRRHYRMAWTHLRHVQDNYRKAAFDRKKDRNLWTLLKSFAMVANDTAIWYRVMRTDAFSRILLKSTFSEKST